MKNRTIGRRLRRETMHANKATFKDRLYEAVRTGASLRKVNFVRDGQRIGIDGKPIQKESNA